jgi:adhesin transport system outer membrane protein
MNMRKTGLITKDKNKTFNANSMTSHTLIILLICVIFSLAVSAANAQSSSLASSSNKKTGLPAALEATLMHHPAAKGQHAQLSKKEFVIDGEKASRYPSISITANSLNEDYNQATLRVDQPIWTFGRISSSIDIAKADYKIEESATLQVTRSLLEKTALAYSSVQSAQLKTVIAAENLIEHETFYDKIKRREVGQLASKADVNLAYSRLLEAQAAVQNYNGSLAVALNELQSLTRIKVATDLQINEQDIQLPNIVEIKDLAIDRSADIALSRERLKLVEAQLASEKLSFMPTLSFRVEHELLETDPDFNTSETRAGLVLEGALDGLGFSSYSRIKGASAAINAAQYEVDDTIIESVRQVENLTINRTLQGDLRIAQRLAVTALEETMASFLRQYETNRKSWLEILNTQRELTQIRYALIDIDQQWVDISLQIAAIIGQLDALAGMETK